MQDFALITRLLIQLLSENSPELGARLKHRLNAKLINMGMGNFDEKSLGYKKFTDLLSRDFGNIVQIDRPDDGGDVFVSLRPQAELYNKKSAFKSPVSGPVVRSDVWQAFSNPDPARKRFLHRETGILRHFLQQENGDSGSAAKKEVNASPDKFVEILPIAGSTQFEWMRSFLDRIRLAPIEKTALEVLLKEPYSSAVNATFSRALGVQGTSWRQYRTQQIMNQINQWADQNKIPLELLHVHTASKEEKTSLSPASRAALSSREQAIRLLDLLTDEDIKRIFIPTLLASLLAKSQL